MECRRPRRGGCVLVLSGLAERNPACERAPCGGVAGAVAAGRRAGAAIAAGGASNCQRPRWY
ncbi:MAG: hypothetical protein F6K39_02195 [Okeania sp. SIO3B3]|nr:hypothetical protein [Okeania sp. SIO3B3]